MVEQVGEVDFGVFGVFEVQNVVKFMVEDLGSIMGLYYLWLKESETIKVAINCYLSYYYIHFTYFNNWALCMGSCYYFILLNIFLYLFNITILKLRQK
jgi:hypothetical protein